MLVFDGATTNTRRIVDNLKEAHQMIYVIVVIVLVVLIVGALLARRRGGDRGVTWAPDLRSTPVQQYSAGAPAGPGPLPQVPISSPEVTTEGIAHDEFVSDVSDDLLDPRNPHHAEWVKEHPGMETDEEWVKDHPEDQPT
jgi:hypothetical protein